MSLTADGFEGRTFGFGVGGGLIKEVLAQDGG